VGGDLDKKRAELIKPVQDRLYNALQRIANEKGYAFIFDKAGNPYMAYVNPKYDVSTQVLEMLGVTGAAPKGDKADSASDTGGKKTKGSSKDDSAKKLQSESKNGSGTGKMKR
jgi:hypothetical protein